MKKTEVAQIIAAGCKPLVSTDLPDGRYFANKVNDDYTVLQKQGEKWVSLQSVKDAVKTEPVVILNDCKDAKTQSNRSIAVNDEFMTWAVGTGFSFTAKGGRTKLNLEKFDAKKMKE